MSNLAEKIRLARERGLEGDDLKVLLKKRKLNYEKKKPRKEKQEDVIRKKKNLKRIEAEKEAKLRALELAKLKLEFERSKLGRPCASVDSVGKPALPKLPVFNEASDSIDAYILCFERLATSASWDKGIWAKF